MSTSNPHDEIDYLPPPDAGLDLVHADDDLVVVAKPAGLLSVPGRGAGRADCMASRVQARFAECFPALGRPKLKAAWAGMIDTMPDVVPVVDRATAVPGLVIATGMSGHGFGIGPGMGRVVADLVAGNATGHDLGRFRLSRFTDGSKIAPGPSL